MNPYEAVCIEVLTVRVAARRSKEVRKTPGGRRFLARGRRKEAGGEGLGAMSNPSLSLLQGLKLKALVMFLVILLLRSSLEIW